MNQEQFWTQIGVTQSGGSRYESGREMPRPVKELLRLVHVEQIDLSQVKRVDFEIISYLKEAHPDLYRSLRRAARSRSAGQEPSSADIACSAGAVVSAAAIRHGPRQLLDRMRVQHFMHDASPPQGIPDVGNGSRHPA